MPVSGCPPGNALCSTPARKRAGFRGCCPRQRQPIARAALSLCPTAFLRSPFPPPAIPFTSSCGHVCAHTQASLSVCRVSPASRCLSWFCSSVPLLSELRPPPPSPVEGVDPREASRALAVPWRSLRQASEASYGHRFLRSPKMPFCLGLFLVFAFTLRCWAGSLQSIPVRLPEARR